MTNLEEEKEMEFKYQGMVIKVSADGYFTRETGEVNALGALRIDKYDSLAKAKTSVDTELATARKSKASEVNVILLDEAAHTMTVRRVHENTGEWLTGKDEWKKPYSGYLVHDVAKALLAQRHALREQMKELDASLKPYVVELPRAAGKQTPERVERLVEKLNDAVAEAQEKVANLSKPVEV